MTPYIFIILFDDVDDTGSRFLADWFLE